MKNTPASLRSDGPLAAISETGGRNAAKSLAELSEIHIKRLCLPHQWQSFTLPTLRHRVLMIPAQFTRTRNVPTLKFQKSYFHEETFEFVQNNIKTLEPLV